MTDTVGLGIAITLADMFTKPLRKAGKGVDNFNAKLAAVSTTSVAVGQKLYANLGKLYDTFSGVAEKQGDLMSLGIDTRGMELITQKGLEFANTWSGVVVRDFTGAAYDIKSGISSLTDEGVGEMTRYALLTGKATKSNAETMSKVFALGHGIFRDEFNSDFEFGQKFSASIAATVQLFRTDGEDIARGISNLGATAQKFGVTLAEELAVLGMSKSAFDSAAEGATSYKAFLMATGKAQEELGMKFVDSRGKMLPMVKILEKIKQRFGDLDASEIDQLKKAFGSDEAVKIILALIDKTDELRESEEKLKVAQKKGLDYTKKMAEAREYGQESKLLSDQMNSLAYTFGKLLAPAMGWVAKKFGRLVTWIQKLTDEHAELASNIATGLVVFAGLATILGTTGIAIAGFSLGLSTLGISMSGLLLVGAPVMALLAGLAVGGYYLYQNWEKVSDFLAPFFKWVQIGLKGASKHLDRLVKHLQPLINAFDWLMEKGRQFLDWLASLIGINDDAASSYAKLSSAGLLLGQKLSDVFGALVDIIGAAVRGWVKIFEWGWAGIEKIISWVPDGTIGTVWSGVKAVFSTALDGWGEIFRIGMGYIRGEIAFDPKAIISSMWSGVKNIFSTAVEGWKMILKGFWDWVVGIFDKIMKKLGLVTSAAEKAKSMSVNGGKYDHLPEKTFIKMGMNPEDRDMTTVPNIPTAPIAPVTKKEVHITEGDIHLTVQGDTNPEVTAKKVMGMIEEERRDKKNRSAY